MNLKNYSVGLDIGTTSVGWAVIDENYRLLKKGNKNMWGSYLFKKGETAEERRGYRSQRRRLNRRKRRISLLKDLLGEMILQKDAAFFIRLEKGAIINSSLGNMYNLFDGDFSDKEYYDKFPTIYHLRNHLCMSNVKEDPRLIYLALHHIIKYRGNFLFEGQDFNVTNKSGTIEAMGEVLNQSEWILLNNEFQEEDISMLLNDLCDTNQMKKVRFELAVDKLMLNVENKNQCKALINLFLGNTTNLVHLFNEDFKGDDGKAITIGFASNKYDEELSQVEGISSECANFIEKCNSIYSFIQLNEILDSQDSVDKKQTTISSAKVGIYESHREDLIRLKAVIKKYFDQETYAKVFKDASVKGNYFNYINNSKETPQNDEASFSRFIEKLLVNNENCQGDNDVKCILAKIDDKKFMPKPTTKDNSVIPYQLHKTELIQIIDNQKQFYPILAKNKDKILSLLEFRIPYYVGPLSNIDDAFAWIVKKDKKAKIYPWNFEEIVDREQSAEIFIRKMTNRCTYLWDEDVLPKKSLVYSKFEVLNELNNINVLKKDKTGDLKREIYQNLFLKKVRVTEADLRRYLVENNYCSEDVEIKGFQKEHEFASSLEPWIKFKKIFKDSFEEHFDDIEQMIEWLTVYEDKNILKLRLRKNFTYLSDGEVMQICKLKFNGWGRLSQKLLTELKQHDENEGCRSILDYLYLTNNNFMQIITNKKYGFNELIENYNKDEEDIESIAKAIDEIPCSPAVKKGIRQVSKIIEDIVKVMKCEPKSIFLEFAREDRESMRTKSKYDSLVRAYQNFENSEENKAIFTELKKLGNNGQELNNKALFLYFLQRGKCLYSGLPLNVSQLHTYQIDHIVPQSYIKDDSIDNLALVKSLENQYKGDDLLISSTVQERQKAYWLSLKKSGLMSEKKFSNLTRKTISEFDEIRFINRQLVETRQITKYITNLFSRSLKNTTIGSIKASLVSDFRHKYKVYKIRNLNDFHHAHDAYITCVLGNFVLKKYPSLKNEFIFNEYNQLKDFKKQLIAMNQKQKNNGSKNLYGFILNQFDFERVVDDETGEILWSNEYKKMVLNSFEYKDCHVVYKPEEVSGGMFHATLDKKTKLNFKDKHKIIAKNKEMEDVELYGGYSSIQNACMVIVSYESKKGRQVALENVPIIYKDDDLKLKDFLSKEFNVKEITIHKKILMNQKIKIGMGYYYLASAHEFNNATQLILSKKSKEVVYKILNDYYVNDEDFMFYLREHLEKLNLYYPLYSSIYETLSSKQDAIMKLNSRLRKQFVNQFLVLTSANKANANFKIEGINMGDRKGRLSRKKCNVKETTFILSSPTGLFSSKVTYEF